MANTVTCNSMHLGASCLPSFYMGVTNRISFRSSTGPPVTAKMSEQNMIPILCTQSMRYKILRAGQICSEDFGSSGWQRSILMLHLPIPQKPEPPGMVREREILTSQIKVLLMFSALSARMANVKIQVWKLPFERTAPRVSARSQSMSTVGRKGTHTHFPHPSLIWGTRTYIKLKSTN